MPLSDYALDNFVAPDLSKLTICGAPELAQDAVSMNNAVLNLIFTSSWTDKVRRTPSASSLFGMGRNVVVLAWSGGTSYLVTFLVRAESRRFSVPA